MDGEKTITDYRQDVVQFLLEKSRKEEQNARANNNASQPSCAEIENLTKNIMKNLQQS